LIYAQIYQKAKEFSYQKDIKQKLETLTKSTMSVYSIRFFLLK